MPDDSIRIPRDLLSPEALTGLIEEFVSRDGTNLADLDDKVRQVRGQLECGEVVIMFDPETETTNIVPAPSNA